MASSCAVQSLEHWPEVPCKNQTVFSSYGNMRIPQARLGHHLPHHSSPPFHHCKRSCRLFACQPQNQAPFPLRTSPGQPSPHKLSSRWGALSKAWPVCSQTRGRNRTFLRGALKEQLSSSPPDRNHRNPKRERGGSLSKEQVDMTSVNAPSPSPLNLLLRPDPSTLSVNLEPLEIAPGVFWIPSAQEDPVAYNVLGLTANAYLCFFGKQAVAIDATSPFIIPLLRSLLHKEHATLSALLLTHRHIAAAGKPKGKGLKVFLEEFPGVPVYLHPADVQHEDAKLSGAAYQNPLKSALLDGFGFKTWAFPGHTLGHVQYYLGTSGGVLFTGDTAVGAPMHRAKIRRDKMTRAPVHLNEDDQGVAKGWSRLLHSSTRPAISTICPYHGKAYWGETPARVESLLTPLQSPWPTLLP